MKPISFKRHRFPPDVIRLGVWLYYRFTLSLRDVEDLLTERSIVVAYETVRCWSNKFGPAIAANIRKRRHRADCCVALGRDGREDRRQANVYVAGRRQGSRGPRRPPPEA